MSLASQTITIPTWPILAFAALLSVGMIVAHATFGQGVARLRGIAWLPMLILFVWALVRDVT